MIFKLSIQKWNKKNIEKYKNKNKESQKKTKNPKTLAQMIAHIK